MSKSWGKKNARLFKRFEDGSHEEKKDRDKYNSREDRRQEKQRLKDYYGKPLED